jgi:hypothetical protein
VWETHFCSSESTGISNVFCGSGPRLYNEDLTQLELELNPVPELAVAAENSEVTEKKWQERN